MRTSVHFTTTVYIVILTSVIGIISGSVVDDVRYVGCFDPGYSLRQRYHYHIPSVTLEKCVQKCQVLKTRFAAVEASDNFCYCGADIGEESPQRNDTLCNIPCPDEPLRTCGGDWLISVYEIPGASSAEAIDDVDFLVGISTGVRLYHSGSSITYDTLMTTTDWVYSVDYHFSKNILFAFTKKRILKTILNPEISSGTVSSSESVIKNVSVCDGFAVDWVHDRVYWANCSADGTSIMSCGLDGEAEETVVVAQELNGKGLKRMEIDPYRGILFWTADGVLQSVETSGANLNLNLTKEDINIRAVALDLKLRRVYFVATVNQSYSLNSIDYAGGEEVEHFSVSQLRSVYGLGILGDRVFWVNYANVRDVIYEAPLNLTGNEEVKMFRAIDRAVWHMRVVHPSLQRRPKLDPCLEKSCEHSCHATSATSAKCDCPPGQTLNHDGVSCRVDATSSRHQQAATGVGVISISILLVVAVLLMSVVLMYVWDKYWSLLATKLSGIRYTRSRSRDGEGEIITTTEHQLGEDSVNLI